MNADLSSTAALLCARQIELHHRLERLERDMRRTDDPLVADVPDQALQQENDDVIDRLRALTEVELDRIDVALARLAAERYGSCEACGRPLARERLAALPESVLCNTCAATLT